MPSHRWHRLVNRAVLGRDYDFVNKMKDAPYRLWPGKRHREWFHDKRTNYLLGALFGPEAWLAGELHDWLDWNYIEDRDTGKLIPRKKQKKWEDRLIEELIRRYL